LPEIDSRPKAGKSIWGGLISFHQDIEQKLARSGLTEEELEREQRRLFGLASGGLERSQALDGVKDNAIKIP